MATTTVSAFPLREELARGLKRLQEDFAADERCLGIYLWGAHSTNTSDEFSDLDVAVVVRDNDYKCIKDTLRRRCDACFGPIVAWLPEGEREGIVNCAFLFKSGDELALADLLLLSESMYRGNPTARTECILFDRDRFVVNLTPSELQPEKASLSQRLEHCLQDYWTYMYLNGKYFKRRDLFKILSTQEALFQRHVNLLRLLFPRPAWSGWAAKDVRHFPQESRERLLLYFSGARMETIGGLLKLEMDRFSLDARKACRQHNAPYSDALEECIRNRLAQIFLL